MYKTSDYTTNDILICIKIRTVWYPKTIELGNETV
jgi:hypothetical protein